MGDFCGILELLIEVTLEQQDGIFELALVVGQRAFAEFADHPHGGANEDRRDQQTRRKRLAIAPGPGYRRGCGPRSDRCGL